METKDRFINEHSVKRGMALTGVLLAVLCGCRHIDPNPDPEPEPEPVEFSLEFSAPQTTVVWPSEKGDAVIFPFTVQSTQKLESLEVDLRADAGLKAVCTLAADHMSGEVRISGTSSFETPSAGVAVTARSGEASATASLMVERAVLETESSITSFPQEGGSQEFTFRTNIPCSVALDCQSGSFASVSADDGKAVLTLAANDGYSSREGTVTIADLKGILPSLAISFSQAGSSGSRQTDSLALVKFYNEMEMGKWKEQGSFDVLYANWCTSAPLENWCGVSTDSDVDPVTFENLHDGRVKRLKLQLVMDDGSENNRPIPECIGELKALTQLDLVGDFMGELPSSLASLANLNRVHIYSDPGKCRITGDLNDHPLQAIASHIKFWNVCGDLYGTVPVWFSKFADFRLDDTHYSGRIPDEVVASDGMQKDNIWYETIGGVDLWTLKEVDATIIKNCSLSSYALWYGEKTPEGVEFVEDSHSGHWQWKSLEACIAFVMEQM